MTNARLSCSVHDVHRYFQAFSYVNLQVNHDEVEGRQSFESALSQLAQGKEGKERYEVLLAYARYLHDDLGCSDEAGGHLRECIKIDAGDTRAIAFYAKLLHNHYKDVGLADRYF